MKYFEYIPKLKIALTIECICMCVGKDCKYHSSNFTNVK